MQCIVFGLKKCQNLTTHAVLEVSEWMDEVVHQSCYSPNAF